MLRASDLDRERVAERLRQAAAEGRLVAEELEERLGEAFSARTYGQLDALVTDLPVPRREGNAQGAIWLRAGFALALLVAALAVVAMAALVVLGAAAAWLAWVVLMWVVWGRRRRSFER
jgi:Flp pilus assembly protein TadB